MIVGIQHGTKEPIVVVVLDDSGQPLVGLTDIELQIRRQSDGGYFDWTDNRFKAGVSVVQISQKLVEISSIYSPGEYQLDTLSHVKGFDTSLIVNPEEEDIYFLSAMQIGGFSAANMPQVSELRVGTFVVADHAPVIF